MSPPPGRRLDFVLHFTIQTAGLGWPVFGTVIQGTLSGGCNGHESSGATWPMGSWPLALAPASAAEYA